MYLKYKYKFRYKLLYLKKVFTWQINNNNNNNKMFVECHSAVASEALAEQVS